MLCPLPMDPVTAGLVLVVACSPLTRQASTNVVKYTGTLLSSAHDFWLGIRERDFKVKAKAHASRPSFAPAPKEKLLKRRIAWSGPNTFHPEPKTKTTVKKYFPVKL